LAGPWAEIDDELAAHAASLEKPVRGDNVVERESLLHLHAQGAGVQSSGQLIEIG
jgi:hypothetical protein